MQQARILNNAVRFSQTTVGIYGNTLHFYLGMDADREIPTSGTTFDSGDYFLCAKVQQVSDVVIHPGDLEIEDQIRQIGCITPKLNVQLPEGSTPSYTWYRSYDGGKSWGEVVRARISGDDYNLSEDGDRLNVALDKGAQGCYKVALKAIDDIPLSGGPVESQPFHVPYFDNIQNGDFEEPFISTEVDDPEHYQPLLPNGTAGMVWKTTAADGTIEFISVASPEFEDFSLKWHNCESAASGKQYVELNAGMAGALYQDVLTVPGSRMYWSLAHRGRGTQNMAYSASAKDTMYVVIMSTVLAEKYNITTQEAVRDVTYHPEKYPGASVRAITDDNLKWYYTGGEYSVPRDQYLTRYFFVAGETAFDSDPYADPSLAYTVGNHLDDIYFSTELPPPAKGNVNLKVEKTIVGLDEEAASALLQKLSFNIGDAAVSGSCFENFTRNENGSYTAVYQLQMDIGQALRVTKSVREQPFSAFMDGYDVAVSVSVNNGTPSSASSADITIADRGSGVVSFTNTYSRQTTSLELQKTDEAGLALSGASFRLEYLLGGEWAVFAPQITVDAFGCASVVGMEYDTLYRLTEVAAPSGYSPLPQPIYFKILPDQSEPVPCDAAGATLQQWHAQVEPMPASSPGLLIRNKPGVLLPQTGGNGPAMFYILGSGLLAASFLLSGWIRKKKRKENA